MVTDENAAEPEAFSRATLKEAGIDHKLSSQAQKWARLGEGDFDAKLEDVRNRIISGGAKQMDGARSLMASRQEAIDSLDFFPTPPWATRALVEDVLPQLGVRLADATVWEPACGEGHISGVLQEYAREVTATDVFDYSIDGRSAPGWRAAGDFLETSEATAFGRFDWIITNPPFDAKAVAFVQKALEVATVGVAMFFRSQWAVEGVERYEAVFRDHPPTLSAWFVERVNLCKGRWDPDGSTATAYCWLVWLKGEQPRAPYYIPPGRRDARAKVDDVERFTAHPVLSPVGHSQSGSGLDSLSVGHSRSGSGLDEVLRRAEAGEGGDVDPPLPPVDAAERVEPATEQSAPHTLSLTERDAIIREVYSRPDVLPDFAEIEQRTGLDKVRARKRAYQLGLSSRERQKAAASAYTTGQHQRGEL